MLRWGLGGGLLSALTVVGVPEEQAHTFAEGVRREDSLAAATTDAILGSAIYDLMQRPWRRSGSERSDPNAGS